MGLRFEKDDPTEAVKWFDLASNQHDSDAYYKLGLCYINGTGVDKDADKGTRYVLFAARQLGNSNAKKYLENNYPGLSAKFRADLSKILPAGDPLLQEGSTWQANGDAQSVKRNFQILYFKNALNERCSLFLVGHPNGSGYADTIFSGDSNDPRWELVVDNSDYQTMHVILRSGGNHIVVLFDYSSRTVEVRTIEWHGN